MTGHQMKLGDAFAVGIEAAQAADMAAGQEFAAAADEFLRAFAAQASRPFASETVVRAAAEAGIVCAERRAWGPAFTRAARRGLIRRTAETYRRAWGHGAPNLMWEACQ